MNIQTRLIELPGKTIIKQRVVDWGEDLPWVTLAELACRDKLFGRPDMLLRAARLLLRAQRGTGRSIFINPEFSVYPPQNGITNEFLTAARRSQKTFLSHFKSILFSSRRLKNELRQVDPLTRQLAYTGVLLIDGEHIHPQRWPRKTPTPIKSIA